MRNPIFNKQHIAEYILYGFIGAIAYTIALACFLNNNKYENFYYLYIGNGAFMFVIFYYAFRLLYRPYDSKRAVSMLIAGNFATLVGVALSAILAVATMLFFYPALFASVPADKLIEDAPGTIQPHNAGGLLVMIFINAIVGNFAVGTFISVVTAYAGKREQRGDKTESLKFNIPDN